MTVVSSASADAFIRRLPREMRFFLVHGMDEGLAHERTRGIVKALTEGDDDPLRLLRLEGDAVARDPGMLADEAYAIAMFGGARAIWIDAQARDLLPALEPLFAQPPQDSAIVVKAGVLKKGLALRNAFEKHASAAAIECYPDNRRDLAPLIEAEAHAAGMTIAAEAREALVDLLGSDRLTTRGEIAKLLLYARGKARIELADVEAIVADAAPSGLDAMIDLALAGDLSAAEAEAGRYFGEGGDPGQAMTRLVQRATLIYRLRVEMEQGRSFDAASQTLGVRLPFAARAALARQAERWSSETLARRLPQVRTAAARVRAEPQLAVVLATRALWALAARSATRR